MTEKIKAEKPNEVTTLSKLALELKIYRSKLDFYMASGLIIPINKINKLNLFDKQKTLERLKEIEKLQRKGKTLKEIKELLDNN